MGACNNAANLPIEPPPATPFSGAKPVLELSPVHFGFDAAVPLLKLAALQLPPGVTWLAGGEGRGKTTLLRLLAGTLPLPASRILRIAGLAVPPGNESHRPQVAWFDPLTVACDHQTATQCWEGAAPHFPLWDAALLVQLQGRLGLQPHLDKPLYMLSTGSKRKVWLAAALASGAAVTLLDMPFAALDKASASGVLDLLADAADHTSRAWVVADYVAPTGIPLAQTIDLGE